MTSNVLEKVELFFDEKIRAHGATFMGLDYNSTEAQTIRFDQLIKLFKDERNFTLNDYGCGYGSLYDYLTQKGYAITYSGYDISKRMVEQAHRLHTKEDGCRFSSAESDLEVSDYTLACGIFNLKMDTAPGEWEKYIRETLQKLFNLSRKGFAFNMLTKYSDPDRMRPDLYYGDPTFYFDYCKRHFSRNVALLHDYDLYDFTILVRLSS